MSLNKRETVRKSVNFYYAKYRHLEKMFTVNHFVSEGASRSTIFDIIKRFESGKSMLEVTVQSKFSIKSPKKNLSE